MARAELARSLAVLCGPPGPAQGPIAEAAGLPGPPPLESHTSVLVLQCHPYASVHLGAEGMLGGEAADRVAGFWRALGLTPPPDADRLDRLLVLYAELRDLAGATDPAADRGDLGASGPDFSGSKAGAADRARSALLWEHLAPWLPGWLEAVGDTGDPWYKAWAALAAQWLRAELIDLRHEQPAVMSVLPLALRHAPEPWDTPAGAGNSNAPAGQGATRRRASSEVDLSVTALLDLLVAPIRSGIILTPTGLAAAAAATQTGLRRGERRFVLRSLLEQDPHAVLLWLAGEARRWQDVHRAWRDVLPECASWWQERARTTEEALLALVGDSTGTFRAALDGPSASFPSGWSGLQETQDPRWEATGEAVQANGGVSGGAGGTPDTVDPEGVLELEGGPGSAPEAHLDRDLVVETDRSLVVHVQVHDSKVDS